MKSARILLTGSAGQLGKELAVALRPLGELFALDRTTLDLQARDQVVGRIREIKPTLIVNAGAFTAVDRAETEQNAAFEVNGMAPGIMAEEARRIGALLVHYSTDYVFDGKKRSPYIETDLTAPLNVYGKSKLAGEQAISEVDGAYLILRTSWVYGWHGHNFFLTMRRLAKEREVLTVVADQVGVPNWSRTLAQATASLVELGIGEVSDRRGLYHLSSHGCGSWYDFAQAIVNQTSSSRVEPITTAQYPLPAVRPSYGVLSVSRLESTFNIAMPTWQQSLADCFANQPPGL